MEPFALVLIPVVALAAGASVGSFLNGLIHNIPHGLKTGSSKQANCPDCNRPLKIPIVSWLIQRGKCRGCGGRLPRRIPVVETLTAAVFLALGLLFFPKIGIIGGIALATLAALMIAANFIDFDHLILPDSITLGGIGAGLFFSVAAPTIQSADSWLGGLFAGLFGATFGFVLLWLIATVAKLMFGKIHHEFSSPVEFSIAQPGGEDAPILIKLGSELTYEWQDVFYRFWDKARLETSEVLFNGELRPVTERFEMFKNGFMIDGVKTRLNHVEKVSGQCSSAMIPREVIGHGNVKFVAMIGAFLGWKAVLVSVAAAFCMVPLIRIFYRVRRRFFRSGGVPAPFPVVAGPKVPFSPLLSLGTLVFLYFLL